MRPRSKEWRRAKMNRRTIRRAFLKWLKINRSRLAVEIELGCRTEEMIAFSLVGINPVITASLGREINVSVTYESYCWDLLLCLDEPQIARVRGGYVCTQCLPESRKVFPDRFSIYADHLFERLLDWVNDDLAKAKWLKLSGRPGDMTWVELKTELPEATESQDEEEIYLPLRFEGL